MTTPDWLNSKSWTSIGPSPIATPGTGLGIATGRAEAAAPHPTNKDIMFVTGSENKAQTTIHMFFMLFSIGVVWLDAKGKVVDKQLAKPWRPAYVPRAPAQYFIEANPSILQRVEIGDRLRFDENAAPSK